MTKYQRNWKDSFLLKAVLIIGFILYCINYYFLERLIAFNVLILVSQIFLALGIISVALIILKNTNLKLKAILQSIVYIFLLVNLYLGYFTFKLNKDKWELSRYENLKNCDVAVKQFYLDIENEDIKYFSFGLGTDEEFNEKMKVEYDIQVYHIGCIVDPKLDCYNKEVQKLVREKFKVEI